MVMAIDLETSSLTARALVAAVDSGSLPITTLASHYTDTKLPIPLAHILKNKDERLRFQFAY